ncbi:LolA family protein [Fictibacillus gelatini]|uniref:LolA family protein n=1 Tax=Fictibacillus gelatini TaxID=225985 RepID=UPI00040D049E|nr:outer membrane lipoprotein carrier protein LolA [Fictibacillus gelatini]
MKKTLSIALMALLFIFALAGCGAKSQDDVVQSLSKKIDKMSGYKANATMTLQTGEKPVKYSLEIWYKKPNFYRVNLKNAKKDQSQMILRNKDGVFVLTPALNKSFRFDSDWPENNSQIYLVESLVSDILNDSTRSFKKKEDSYVFHTKTHYQNKNLYQQEITISKDLSPKQVRVMDKDEHEIVKLDFTNVQFDPKFDKNAFDMQTNMTGAQLELPTLGEDSKPMETVYPNDTLGLKAQKEKTVKTEEGSKVVLSYSDENEKKSFTLIEQKVDVVPTQQHVSIPEGEPVDLGFTIGAMDTNSISWTHNGIDYFLASTTLKQEELISIARSVYEHVSK